LSLSHRGGRREYFWNCACSCGRYKAVRGQHLRHGRALSCGCIHGIEISPLITPPQLKRLIRYNKRTGIFRWRVTTRKTKKGDVAGCVNGLGYIQLSFNKRMYLGHVIAWLYVTGEWPVNEIDHRDGNPSNNKWKNLRQANRSNNCANSKMPCNNTSGFKGVSAYLKRFRSYIQGEHLGCFDTAEEAALAYDAEARRRYGQFARTNFSG
jgi:hypothetical protein